MFSHTHAGGFISIIATVCGRVIGSLLQLLDVHIYLVSGDNGEDCMLFSKRGGEDAKMQLF